jgi:nucleoside-diphosphate-sugar epimerase
MRVLIAGGTGAIGRRLVPVLVSAGHDVTALSRSGAAVEGAGSVRADALDAAAVRAAVEAASPDAVVNLLTAIPDPINPRKMSSQFALTNRLRVEGTRNLLACGVSRVVAESIAFSYAPAPGLADESSPLWDSPPSAFAPVLDAVRVLESQTLSAGGTVLRVGQLHGPGTSFGAAGAFRAAVSAKKLPVVGHGGAVFSFAHVDDVASAFAAALDGPAGVYNVVDDDPAPVSEWLPAYAAALGASAPRRVPAALARLAVGGWGVAFMTRLRGAANQRARSELGWAPTHSWRTTLADPEP